jgi:hypothetical protein
MQLTASKPAIYAFSACRRDQMLRGMPTRLAAADLVCRQVVLTVMPLITPPLMLP